MAPPNVDLVRSILAAWERGDFSSVSWAHPEIEYVNADGPMPGTWRGPPGIAEGFRGILDAWDNVTVETYEYRELGSERILVLFRRRGRGEASGVELAQVQTGGALLQIRNGQVIKLVVYFERNRAFADLGLQE